MKSISKRRYLEKREKQQLEIAKRLIENEQMLIDDIGVSNEEIN